MYIVFQCKKCEHQLYMLEESLSAKAMEKLSMRDCPACGEEGYENWIVIGTADSFPGDEEEEG